MQAPKYDVQFLRSEALRSSSSSSSSSSSRTWQIKECKIIQALVRRTLSASELTDLRRRLLAKLKKLLTNFDEKLLDRFDV